MKYLKKLLLFSLAACMLASSISVISYADEPVEEYDLIYEDVELEEELVPSEFISDEYEILDGETGEEYAYIDEWTVSDASQDIEPSDYDAYSSDIISGYTLADDAYVEEYAANISWPAGKIQTYVKSTKNDTKVYKTATSTDGSYGTIYASDLITLNSRQGSRFNVTYPTSKGNKTGWIEKSAVTSSEINVAKKKYTANAKITTYRRAGGGTELGYISKGDTVYEIASSNGYTQVIYPVSGGYKMGWINSTPTPTAKPAATSNSTLSNALYKINVSGSKITCGYDGYKNTAGRHEGIDFKNYIGANVYSLTDGVITRVAKGSNGSGGLSTIAIYNKSANKTVVYLHTAPLSSLKTGQSIKKGDRIATEAWRGISTKDGSHTHVEVREGKQQYAAKSVGDYDLTNPNPTSFWKSQGYTVK